MAIAAAPWHSTIEALLWLHRATPAARAALPAELVARAGLGVTIGGLISYLDGPVGPYGEVFGAPVLLRDAPLLSHVAFMAVDSEASVAGGRGNWALPKVLASFDGRPGLPGPVGASGDGWALTVTATARARARLARAEVRHERPSQLSGWLAEGHHAAVLISGTQDVSAPR